ncbi:MAG: arginine deiminase [Actinobacteria bacterium]|nr:arginine deiminase [Actinomycetota bacterium]
MTTVGIRSEVGRLRSVLVHRPDLELARVTPDSMDELLFDELIWVDRARDEHRQFTSILRQAGAEVLVLGELLAEVLADSELARQVVAAHVTDMTCGPALAARVRGYLLDLPPDQLVRHLIGGVTLEEVSVQADRDSLVASVHQPFELLVPPLPNAVFTRDSSAWIGDGVVISPMNRLVRRREADLLRLVYSAHPRFADASIWFGAEPVEYFPATVEGGDVLVVADRGLAIGLSERSTASGVEMLAARLFEADVVERIVVVDLPKARTTMHLDTVVTMVDFDAFVLYPRIRAQVRCLRITPRDGLLDVRPGGDLLDELAWAADLDQARGIEPEFGSVRAEREQWNDANNVLAIAPGEVVAYERNAATNAILEDAGITVHRMPSNELPRGRGGPRCMTCPVRRDQL